MLSGVFTGCSHEPQYKPQKVESLKKQLNDKEGQENQIKLKVISMFGGTDPNAPIFEDAIEEFMLSHSNSIIENKSDVADETWKSNMLTDFEAGNELDVIGIELPTDWGKLEKAIITFKEKGIIPIAAALGHIPHYLIENFILAEGDTLEHNNTIILPMLGTGNGKKGSTEIISGFSSGFYITRKAWDDPKKRDASVKFVMDMTSTKMI